jgi:hypothetical protein
MRVDPAPAVTELRAPETAREAPSPLRAVITARRPLAWESAGDRAAAGTPHPRAASGLAWVGSGAARRLALVQDDASSVALVDPQSGRAEAIALPATAGARRFDPGFGDKRDKPDLECCLSAVVDGREVLLAFGSGSTPRRERIALLERADGGGWRSRFVAAPELYGALRAEARFSGGALNMEGAACAGARVWLFQRGNGGAHPAIVSVTFEALWRYLAGGPVPALADVARVDLGMVQGVPLGFTDAAIDERGRVMWLASAERSPNTFDDGEVVGSAIGFLADGRAALLCEADGAPFVGKAEGLALEGADRAWVAVDPDDPTVPAELLEVRLEASDGG